MVAAWECNLRMEEENFTALPWALSRFSLAELLRRVTSARWLASREDPGHSRPLACAPGALARPLLSRVRSAFGQRGGAGEIFLTCCG
ncbi:unnamed protein product, partial [Amoebophrya sp. A120]|eukprot:GSA120T00025059001.1